MATVFRVQKTKDFTVMSNHHLKNKDLSLRSKGLLSFMLSLPEDWDYSLKGLATLNKEGIDAIRSAINDILSVPASETKKGSLAKMNISYTNCLYRPNQNRPSLHWKIQHWIILYRLNLNRASPRN